MSEMPQVAPSPPAPDVARAGEDAWAALRRFTPARIALGHAGASLPTRAHLAFQLAHAQARDAVHDVLDVGATTAGLARVGLPVVHVHSSARDRVHYLLDPDAGRRLGDDGAARLAAAADSSCDVAFVVADGLSARAVERHAAQLLALVVPALVAASVRVGPFVLVEQGRVAIGDAIGAALRAKLVAVLIGERPGLSSPDSLGIYLTWDPRPGRVDAERNCISNVRPEGLAYEAAAHKLLWLIEASLARGLTGLALKEEAPALHPEGESSALLFAERRDANLSDR